MHHRRAAEIETEVCDVRRVNADSRTTVRLTRASSTKQRCGPARPPLMSRSTRTASQTCRASANTVRLVRIECCPCPESWVVLAAAYTGRMSFQFGQDFLEMVDQRLGHRTGTASAVFMFGLLMLCVLIAAGAAWTVTIRPLFTFFSEVLSGVAQGSAVLAG